MIDREAAAQELNGLDGSDNLIADLAALVEAGLIEERPGVAGTRFAARGHDEHADWD